MPSNPTEQVGFWRVAGVGPYGTGRDLSIQSFCQGPRLREDGRANSAKGQDLLGSTLIS